VKWISCNDKLPARWKLVEVHASQEEFKAYRSLLGDAWILKSGLKKWYINASDYWRELDFYENNLHS
jgi:hypothetical protein